MNAASGRATFCHSPESWKDLWGGQVFEKGEVLVDTHIVELAYRSNESAEVDKVYWLSWSITRL